MEKRQAEKGKGKEATNVERKWLAPSAAGDAADLSSSWGPLGFGSTVADQSKKKRAYETNAQIRRRNFSKFANRHRGIEHNIVEFK
jgi:hypothetical protein